MDTIAAFILAGGASRRMGTDKSQLLLAGKSFLEHIAAALAPISSEIAVVGKTATASAERRYIPDVYPNWGALGGVHTALASSDAAWSLIVACDFPFVTTELFERLASMCEGFAAVAPIQSDGIPQPLCALYQTERCLVRAEELIESGERKPIALLQSVQTRWVPFAEIDDLPGAESFFDNINTAADYERIIAKGTVTRMA
ncbi:MAG TPA: molybdenum cofactor guanylyltransferase [Pyrinomonadaceae bacterium]|nr:molybdenum cofactor guanylyltransferase [Pyrinomonadaceae bacterium]